MNKRIITLIIGLAAVCGGAMAQPKVSGRVPTREKRGYDQQIVIDTASVRVLYALNAKDIKDENTYIDLGKLEVGRRVKKYSSEFILFSALGHLRLIVCYFRQSGTTSWHSSDCSSSIPRYTRLVCFDFGRV